jgi:hypothetical protein
MISYVCFVLFCMLWVFHFIVMAVIGYSHLVYRSFLSIYLDCKVLLLRCTIAEGPTLGGKITAPGNEHG